MENLFKKAKKIMELQNKVDLMVMEHIHMNEPDSWDTHLPDFPYEERRELEDIINFTVHRHFACVKYQLEVDEAAKVVD